MSSGEGGDGERQPSSPVDTAAAAFRHATMLHRQGQVSDAEHQYRAVLALDNTHVAARHGLGVLRLQQRDFEGAALLFRQVLESDASFADAHNNKIVSPAVMAFLSCRLTRIHSVQPPFASGT